MRHRAWRVDLDGTLYHPTPVKMMLAFELVLGGRRAIAALRAFRHEHERIRRDMAQATDDPFVLQLERTAARLGIATGELEPVVREWMFRRPGRWIRRFRRRALLGEIAAFRDSGGKTAIVSDYPAKEKLEALGARPLFDAVVANGEERGPGRLKPWPDGYQLAARRLGVEPDVCLVIGDRPDADGEAANRAGMAYRQVPGGSPG
jgi:FMN phosphatase YigB (HAD superfamily)